MYKLPLYGEDKLVELNWTLERDGIIIRRGRCYKLESIMPHVDIFTYHLKPREHLILYINGARYLECHKQVMVDGQTTLIRHWHMNHPLNKGRTDV